MRQDGGKHATHQPQDTAVLPFLACRRLANVQLSSSFVPSSAVRVVVAVTAYGEASTCTDQSYSLLLTGLEGPRTGFGRTILDSALTFVLISGFRGVLYHVEVPLVSIGDPPVQQRCLSTRKKSSTQRSPCPSELDP